MTKPERFLWATNTNHAAGADPWSGQPCKVEPAAGKKATGWVPTERPPAEESNWLMNQIGAWVRWASAMQLESWQATDFSGVTPATNWYYPHALAVAPGAILPCIFAVDTASYVIRADLQGRRWVAEGGGANTLRALWGALAAASWMDIAAAPYGVRLAVADDPTPTTNLAAWAAASLPANWTAIVALATGDRWRSVAHNWSTTGTYGTWVVGALSGVLYSNTAGAGFVTAGTPYANAIDVLRHTHDSGNAYFLAAVTDRIIKSSTGLLGSWSVINPSWGSFQASDMAYDSSSQRWIAVGMATTGDLWYSDDNGATWSQKSAVCPMLSATGRKHIACDGKGGWVVTGSTEGTGTDDVCYYSVDNGITWYDITHPNMFAAGVVYVDGYFTTCGYSAAYRTPAGER